MHVILFLITESRIFENRKEESFSSTGFTSWNDGHRRCNAHQLSKSHQELTDSLDQELIVKEYVGQHVFRQQQIAVLK